MLTGGDTGACLMLVVACDDPGFDTWLWLTFILALAYLSYHSTAVLQCFHITVLLWHLALASLYPGFGT